MKKILLFISAIVIVLFFNSCKTRKAPAFLMDSRQTEVLVEGVPSDKLSGDTINVLYSNQKPYPYVFIEGEASYKAILK